eukprot:snap_masked-scaffold_3-processed-gene-8.25-mRNA-1 protein AED:1.00 eAED:1.00 QI:0/0/0/0/1/1/2/0/97
MKPHRNYNFYSTQVDISANNLDRNIVLSVFSNSLYGVSMVKEGSREKLRLLAHGICTSLKFFLRNFRYPVKHVQSEALSFSSLSCTNHKIDVGRADN